MDETLLQQGFTPQPLSSTQYYELDENGFTILENIITPVWLDRLRQAFEELVEQEGEKAGVEAGQMKGVSLTWSIKVRCSMRSICNRRCRPRRCTYSRGRSNCLRSMAMTLCLMTACNPCTRITANPQPPKDLFASSTQCGCSMTLL